MGWDIDGIEGWDVQVVLDANAFGNYSNPYNGFTYETVEVPTLTPFGLILLFGMLCLLGILGIKRK